MSIDYKFQRAMRTGHLDLRDDVDGNASGALKAVQYMDLQTFKIGGQYQSNSLSYWFSDIISSNLTKLVIENVKNLFDIPMHIGEYLKVGCTLRKLSFTRTPLLSNGIKFIADGLCTNTTLKKLKIIEHVGGVLPSFTEIADMLRVNTCLKTLDLTDTGISYQIKFIGDALEVNNSVVSVSFSHNRITHEGVLYLVHTLKKTSPLRRIYLGGNKLPAECLDALSRTPYLRKLIFSHSDLSLYTGSVLGNLVKLDISASEINDSFACYLSGELKYNRTLKSLLLYANRITCEGIKYITDALSVNTVLTELDISDNDFKLDGVMSICNLLRLNTPLLRLDMGDRGGDCDNIGTARYLADALRVNTILHSLVISHTTNHNHDLKYLMDALRTKSSLTCLDMSYCGISDDNIDDIADMLESNTTLTMLTLFDNNISDMGIEVLAAALTTNRTLESLNLMSNHFNTIRPLLNVMFMSPSLVDVLVDIDDIGENIALTIILDRNNDVRGEIRRIVLMLIHARSVNAAGIFGVLPREIVAMIARYVWATRGDSSWLCM